MQAKCPNDGVEMVETGRLGTAGCWSDSRKSQEITEHDNVSPPLQYAFIPVPPMSRAGHHEAEYLFTRTCPACGLVQVYVKEPERVMQYAETLHEQP